MTILNKIKEKFAERKTNKIEWTEPSPLDLKGMAYYLSKDRFMHYYERVSKEYGWYRELVGETCVPTHAQWLWYEIENDNGLIEEHREELLNRLFSRYAYYKLESFPENWKLWVKKQEIKNKLKQIENDFKED